MIDHEVPHLLLRHQGNHLLGYAVHVAVGSLQAERRLAPVGVFLSGAVDILPVHPQQSVADPEEVIQGLHEFLDLGRGIIPLKIDAFLHPGFRGSHRSVNVGLAAVRQLLQGRTGSQAILDVAGLEGLLVTTENVPEIVGVGPVSQHVGNLEAGPALGVGVARHHDGHLLAAQVVGAGPSLVDALDLPLGVAQADEFLEKLRVAVLDIVHVEHHVVTHFQSQVELLDLFPGREVRRFAGIQGGDLVPDRGPVDLEKSQPQAVRDVLHQGRLPVSRRRDQEQEPHPVRAGVNPGGPDLLGQVVAHQRQIDVVDELVADKGAHHPRLEFLQAHLLALGFHDPVLDRLAGLELGDHFPREAIESLEKLVVDQHKPPLLDPRMTPRKAFHHRLQRHGVDFALRNAAPRQVGRRFADIPVPQDRVRQREFRTIVQARYPVPVQLVSPQCIVDKRREGLLVAAPCPLPGQDVLKVLG